LRLIMPVTHGSGILAQEMNVAILSDQASPAGQSPEAGAPRGRRNLPERLGRHVREHGLYGPALALVLAVAFLLRVWGIKQGLPYSYNSDEQAHFVPRAIAFFWHDLNPHYFLNPPAYSYLLHIVFELWFGSGDAVARTYTTDPSTVFVVARLVSAVLGTVAVGFTYLAGARLFNRAIGLLAAAIMAVAFLPVFYSHLALNDVPTLAPVALALYGAAGVMRRGRRRDYLLAGAAIGLAGATKYTGGIVLACLLVAAMQDASGGSLGQSARRLLLAVAVGVLAFIIANPYALLSFDEFSSGLSQQASLAAGEDPVKLGSHGNGVAYYLWTLTWGFGWVPALAALGGAALLAVRRRIGMALMLIPAPIVFMIFMGNQQRFFGRWLMPIFPILALLGAYGTYELARALGRRRIVRPPVLAALAVVVLLGQGVVMAVHNDQVLSRPDTRSLLRAWMVSHVPAGANIVIEPLVPDSWVGDIGRSLAATPTGERWRRWPTWLTDLDPQGRPLAPGQRRYVVIDQYERNLRPALLDQYVHNGYCWVVIGSLQAGRAFAAPGAAPNAIAYYTQLAQRAARVYHVSPFAPGAHPSPFSFDWSIDYYPRQFALPGPELSVYRLAGGKCGGG
jgi:hypothetical protein